MGLPSQEISVCALSDAYPAAYRAMQIRNWTHVDMVITYRDGNQDRLPAQSTYRESDAHVEIEYVKFNGLRSKETQFGREAIPIPGTRVRVPFELIRSAPYRVQEYDIILSTVDHSYTAAMMISEANYNPVIYETSVDEEITDPRLVFQVIDPANRWQQLYVNVFGQTIILRAGHWANPCPLVGTESNDTFDKGKLCCYLRYPHQYCTTVRSTSTVFEVSLENILNEEPVIVPGGDAICVAPDLDALGRVLAKKRAGLQSTVPQVSTLPNMISKDLYDDAQKQFKAEIDRINAAHKQELENLRLQHETQVTKLQSEIVRKDQEVADLKYQLQGWKSCQTFNIDKWNLQEQLHQEKLKTLKIMSDINAAKDKSFWDNVKAIGTVVTAVASAAVAITAAQNKKGK